MKIGRELLLWCILLYNYSMCYSNKVSEIVLNKCCHITNVNPALDDPVCGRIRTEVEDFYDDLSLPTLGQKCSVLKTRFTSKEIFCGQNSFTYTLNLDCKNQSKDLKFVEDGKLILKQNTYDKDEYCVSTITESYLTFIICNQTCSATRPCISRCCRSGKVLKDDVLGCTPSNTTWVPSLYANIYDRFPLKDEEQKNLRPIFVYNSPVKCENSFPFTLAKDKNVSHLTRKPFKILKDGSAWIRCKRQDWKRIPDDLYCIEGIADDAGEYSGEFDDVVMFDCSTVCLSTAKNDSNSIYGVTLLISSLFFLLTAIVYAIVPEKHSLHGWTTFSYLVAMTVNLFFLALNKFKSHFFMLTSDDTFLSWCSVLGILGHFTILCGFTWMTVIGFDIWCTFRRLRTQQKSLRRLWVLYLPLAICMPGIIVLIGIALELGFREDISRDDIIIPDYSKNCFVSNDSLLPYIYGPIAVLQSINIIFFLHTVFILYRTKKETKFATTSCSKDDSDRRDSIILYGKLMFLMGIPWILEVITWAAISDEQIQESAWYIVLPDLLIIAQSIMVFFIVLMNKETIRSLESNFPHFKKFTSLRSYVWNNVRTRACEPIPNKSVQNLSNGTGSTGVGSKPKSNSNNSNNSEGGIAMRELSAT